MCHVHLGQQLAELPTLCQSLQIVCSADGLAADNDVGEGAMQCATSEQSFERYGVRCESEDVSGGSERGLRRRTPKVDLDNLRRWVEAESSQKSLRSLRVTAGKVS